MFIFYVKYTLKKVSIHCSLLCKIICRPFLILFFIYYIYLYFGPDTYQLGECGDFFNLCVKYINIFLKSSKFVSADHGSIFDFHDFHYCIKVIRTEGGMCVITMKILQFKTYFFTFFFSLCKIQFLIFG